LNGGIADHYVVFARAGEAERARGLPVLIAEAATPGLEIAERLQAIAPHARERAGSPIGSSGSR
jgi:acyl-CoA dehydrogenase